MKQYLVSIREVHINFVRVNAESEKEAVRRVADGGGEYEHYQEYSHTLDPNTWTAEQVVEPSLNQKPPISYPAPFFEHLVGNPALEVRIDWSEL